MFDFEKLAIYQKAKLFTLEIRTYLNHNPKLDRATKDQLHRVSYSILLNLAEGSGRFSKADRRHFFVVSRSSIFECT